MSASANISTYTYVTWCKYISVSRSPSQVALFAIKVKHFVQYQTWAASRSAYEAEWQSLANPALAAKVRCQYHILWRQLVKFPNWRIAGIKSGCRYKLELISGANYGTRLKVASRISTKIIHGNIFRFTNLFVYGEGVKKPID